jgi:hypothetical protein
MELTEAIAAAEALLPGRATGDRGLDPRWQAIVDVAEFIPIDPEPVWEFAARWGCNDDPDLRAAIASCVMEHLLEHHFDLLFARVETLARENASFADTLKLCSELGQAARRVNAARLRQLKGQLRG